VTCPAGPAPAERCIASCRGAPLPMKKAGPPLEGFATLASALLVALASCSSPGGDALTVSPRALEAADWATVSFRLSGLDPSRFLERREGELRIVAGLRGGLGDAPATVVSADGAGLTFRLDAPPAVGEYPFALHTRGATRLSRDTVRVLAGSPDGADAGTVDGGRRDGGSGDAGTCPARCEPHCVMSTCGSCACAAGCPCLFTCSEVPCSVRCEGLETTCTARADGAQQPLLLCGPEAECAFELAGSASANVDCWEGARCLVDVAGAARPRLRCQSGARCAVDLSGSSNALLTCLDGSDCALAAPRAARVEIDCRGARCEVDCTEADGCRVAFGGDAVGTVRCSEARDCGLDACSQGEAACPGDVLVCGEPCP
jgi:hypothetical protein